MGTPTLAWLALVMAPCLVQDDSAPLAVEAWASTAGPYGESWTLTIPEKGDVSLEVLYLWQPMGKLAGEFCIQADRLAPIRDAIAVEEFMELPSRLEPAASFLHQPTLRIEVSFGERHRQVELYDPEALQEDPRAQRFLAVWQELFDLVPMQPIWEQPQNEAQEQSG